MSSFSKKILADGAVLEFSFVRIFTTDGPKYFVTVIDRNLKSQIFNMILNNDNNHWRIIDAPQVPKWIHDVENELSKAIMENNVTD